MKIIDRLNISTKDIAEFCNKYYIKKLALFGSALRGELKEDSDIDILVKFHTEPYPQSVWTGWYGGGIVCFIWWM